MAKKDIIRITYDDKDTDKIFMASVSLVILGWFLIVNNTIQPEHAYVLGLAVCVFIDLLDRFNKVIKKQ